MLGFTSTDHVKFVIQFDNTSTNSNDIFLETEKFSTDQGFVIDEKIEEIFPEKRTISLMSTGRPYQGGVFLSITHFEGGKIVITGVRLVGGCSSPKEIKLVTNLKNGLEAHLQSKFDAGIRITEIENE